MPARRSGAGARRCRGHDAVRLQRRDLRCGDRRARTDVAPEGERDELERTDRADDLLEGHRAEVAEPKDLAGQLALATGEDDAALLELAVEGLPVEAVRHLGRRDGSG